MSGLRSGAECWAQKVIAAGVAPRVRLIEKIQQVLNISTVELHFNRNGKIIETVGNGFCLIL